MRWSDLYAYRGYACRGKMYVYRVSVDVFVSTYVCNVFKKKQNMKIWAIVLWFRIIILLLSF